MFSDIVVNGVGLCRGVFMLIGVYITKFKFSSRENTLKLIVFTKYFFKIVNLLLYLNLNTKSENTN